MKKNNVTCVQIARFFFDFFEKREWSPGEKAPLDNIVKADKVMPESVRELNSFLTERLDRIATMMQLLLDAHDNWAITGRKDKIIMETNSFDFNEALKLLKENGFTDDEFILKVEYQRKWGML